MLTFLWLASRAGFVVASWHDDAVGHMTKDERGVSWVSSVVLRPRIEWAGDKRPTAAEEEHLHHGAHEQCFIANSVRTDIRVEQAG